jgi:Zn-dependent M28 family amino/carboxypeptidase
MIASIAPEYWVYEGTNPADKYGSAGLAEYITSQGKTPVITPFGTSSDYLGFITYGIPSSGLFTGAGAPHDPCYHLACDTTANINAEAFTINAKAAAYQVANLALSDLAGLPRRTKTTTNLRARSEQRNALAKMRREFEELADQSHACSKGPKSVV